MVVLVTVLIKQFEVIVIVIYKVVDDVPAGESSTSHKILELLGRAGPQSTRLSP